MSQALLLERSVVFISRSHTLVTLVVEALHSLLDQFLGRDGSPSPTEPSHVCAPLLPLSKVPAFHSALCGSREALRAASLDLFATVSAEAHSSSSRGGDDQEVDTAAASSTAEPKPAERLPFIVGLDYRALQLLGWHRGASVTDCAAHDGLAATGSSVGGEAFTWALAHDSADTHVEEEGEAQARLAEEALSADADGAKMQREDEFKHNDSEQTPNARTCAALHSLLSSAALVVDLDRDAVQSAAGVPSMPQRVSTLLERCLRRVWRPELCQFDLLQPVDPARRSSSLSDSSEQASDSDGEAGNESSTDDTWSAEENPDGQASISQQHSRHDASADMDIATRDAFVAARRVLEERHDKYTLSYIEEDAVGFASGLFLAALEDQGERVFWSAFLATDHFARLLAARYPE